MKLYHRHTCGCGDYFVCSQNLDHCAPDWTCPTCEQQQRDEYFSTCDELTQPDPQLDLNLIPTEMTAHEKH